MKILLIITCLFILSCGNKRSPTGGPLDTTSPVIIYTIPLEYEQIENNEVIIAFSKIMDKTSVINGLVVTPSKINKKVSWKKSNLHIQFTENLPENTNVHVYFNKSVRCDRNNTLEDHILLTFKNGILQTRSISGYITHENDEFSKMATQLSLLDVDSLLIFNKEVHEDNYNINYLNPSEYTIRAYADVNRTNRYNFGVDPFFREEIETFNAAATVNIHLVVADTVKPNLRRLSNPTKNQLIFEFNKQLAKLPFVSIVEDSTQTEINILHKELIDTQLFVITVPLDTLSYQVQLGGLIDNKGNEREIVNSEFTSSALEDTVIPEISETFPRNGTVVNTILPELKIKFNKILFENEVSVSLLEVETGLNIPLRSIKTAGFELIYTPQKELTTFNSYQFKIILDDEQIIQFIVVS